MTRNPSTALEELRRLAAAGDLDRFCVDHGIRLLIAFGSAARRDDLEPRDLDLAVLLPPGADLAVVVAATMRLLSCDSLDFMDLRGAGLVARGAALQGEPLYEDDAGLLRAPADGHAAAPRRDRVDPSPAAPAAGHLMTPRRLDPDSVTAKLQVLQGALAGAGRRPCRCQGIAAEGGRVHPW